MLPTIIIAVPSSVPSCTKEKENSFKTLSRNINIHTSHTVPCTVFMVLALAVETLDRSIHRINHYPADKY